MNEGNGKRLATVVSIVVFVAGMVIGHLWSMVRHDADFVRVELYDRDMDRIEKKLDRLVEMGIEHMKEHQQGG